MEHIKAYGGIKGRMREAYEGYLGILMYMGAYLGIFEAVNENV